ncbi:MAG TPA: FHA domain-containing protein [Myxococcota bacterium]|nr:FHA domain-containing protein [Myxococcota bacterium]
MSAVGFSIKILGGPDRGKIYEFDRVQITIGRTMDNDVVLTDPGISRQHMSIRDKGGAYILKDLGSSNGTKLNGKLIEEKVLRPGDIITAGSAEVKFESTASSGPAKKTAPRSRGRVRTRKPAARAPARAPARRETRKRPATPLSNGKKKPIIQSKGVREKARAPEVSVGRNKSAGAGTREERPARKGKKTPLGDLIGRISTWFRGLEKKYQIAVMVIAGVLLVLIGVKAFVGTKKIVRQIVDHSGQMFEPGLVDSDGDLVTYGYGPVATRCRDSAAFKFKYANGRGTAIFEVGGINHKEEVAIQLNGMQIGFAPVTMDNWSDRISLNLPRKHLLENEENKLAFINTINYNSSKSSEEWAVKVEAIEESPLPSPDIKAATESFKIAKKRYENKEVSPQNTFEALEYFKKTRDFLELLPVEERPDIYIESIEMVDKLEKELVQRFRDLMFNAEKAQKFARFKKAKALFRQIMRSFPNQEDPRYLKAKEKYDEFE